MPISWNEIRRNAVAFSKEWSDGSREVAEAQTFWNEFFAVFGVKRRTVASFEEPVRKLSGAWGAIDLFWPGTLLVEHKSRGKPLNKAESQAMQYVRSLKDAGRDDEIPRYIIVSDFEWIVLHDLEDDKSFEMLVASLHLVVDKFAFIPGYKQHKLEPDDPVNLRAVLLLGDLHDALEDGGYSGHDLERLLVRVLFCLFAEDTGLFERNAFTDYLLNHTAVGGNDLGVHLARLFQVLDTPLEKRQANLLEELADLPYVNGDLFAESLAFADFSRAMRDRLLTCCRFDWSRISPAAFGSLFQSAMEPRQRRQVGAHYTSEHDILKLVRSLFLDDLRADFDKVKANKNRLREFHQKLGKLTFFDPACGCGNFLVVTYRELRILEIDVLKALFGEQQVLDVQGISVVDVDAMFGIEIKEFPARIAEVALWLVDHQMNQRLSEAFGKYFVRLPLRKSATIRHANALRTDWKTVLPPEKCSYLLGNPPFVGAKYQSQEQQADLQAVAAGVRNAGLLDYVAAWYLKAADYLKGTEIPAAFVSTNSITQGEQVGVLWHELLRRGVRIRFAHRTFAWQSEARGKAHVHVVIIGFGLTDAPVKRIFDYETDPEHPVATVVNTINPYLVDGPETVILNRSKPLCDVPVIKFGNQPIDGGYLILDAAQKKELERECPRARKWIRLFLGAHEYINGEKRWCLWLKDADPIELRDCEPVMRRVNEVKRFRLASKRADTVKLASQSSEFAFVSHVDKGYLIVPSVSSERRVYIPIGFLPASVIASNLCLIVPGAGLFHFGVLSSTMHMAWVRQVCGRLKSDYRYSAKLVYNNVPWPDAPDDKRRTQVEEWAQQVLDARAKFPTCSLADLYDPLVTPSVLVKAHAKLDRAVEKCYRPKAFATDRERVEFLFERYEKLTAPLTANLKAPKRRKPEPEDDEPS